MPRHLRVGIVGSGFTATVHARAALRAGADLVAVATRSGGRAVADALGATHAVTSISDLIAEVDLVHVCTPNALHEQQVLAALEAGRHVVCEKPLATSPAVASTLAAAAEAAGRVATVPFVYRFYGVIREMREQVRAGSPLVQLRGSYLQDWLVDPDSSNWRVDPADGGASRAFGDIGVHWVDLAEFVTGQRLSRLVAQTSTVIPTRPGIEGPIQTEDIASVLFETSSGAIGQLTVSQVSWGRTNRLQLDIDTQDHAWAFTSEREEELWSADRDGIHLVPRGRSSSAAVTRFDRVPAGHPQGYQDCLDAFVADTYRAVAGDIPDGLPTFADGARAAFVTQAVLDSARDGTWVELA